MPSDPQDKLIAAQAALKAAQAKQRKARQPAPRKPYVAAGPPPVYGPGRWRYCWL